jgi:hypothetical protein
MPAYIVNGTTYKTGEAIPSLLNTANGYRLPAEIEWEWAARGGVISKGFLYSGSNTPGSVAWYSENSSGASVKITSNGQGTWPVGLKEPNELGIYDMSGNVWEWIGVYSKAPSSLSYQYIRGGSYFNTANNCTVRSGYADPANNRNHGFGFRYARNASAGIVIEESFETTPISSWKLSANGGGIYQTTNSTAQSGAKSLKLGIGQYQGGQNDSWASAQLSFPRPITNGSVEMYIYTQLNSPFYIYPHLFTESKSWDAGVWIVDSSNTISPGWFETLESQSTAQKITGWQRFKWVIANGKVELWIGDQLIGKAAYKAPPEGLEVSMTSYFVSNVATYIDNIKVEIKNP